MTAEARSETTFLPDFCAVRVLFVHVLAVELLALVLTLAAGGPFWERLALTSLLAQWVALASAALLCPLRRLLSGRSGAATAAALGVAGIVAAGSALAAQGAGLAPQGPAFAGRVVAATLICAGLALRHLYVQHQWRQQVKAEAEARLAALRARIRPHFLFNSMNTIAALTRTDPARAERAVEDLSELFRAALAADESGSTVAAEVALARRYLEIESLRLGPRLAVRWEVEPEAEVRPLPALTLQPLVENAVYHGIEPRPDGGVIEIRGRIEAGALVLEVSNPLSEGAPPRPGHRMALENVRLRLAAAYGPHASLEAGPGEGRFRVRVRVEPP